MRSSHVFSPNGLNNILFSQNCIFETVPAMGTVGGIYLPRARERVKSFQLLAYGSTGGHVFLITSSKSTVLKDFQNNLNGYQKL